MNATLETADDRHVLRFEHRLDHPIERVWRAITEPEQLRSWFPVSEPLKVAESDPPSLLAGTWYGEELRFELGGEGEGCLLVFTHAFADRAKAARDAAGWDCCLARMDALLAGEPLGERESLERWPDIHERYAESFGVDPRLGRETFAKHVTRQT
jgi:hypothetical protein